MSEIVVNRYSDEDLEEFKALIEKKIEEARNISQIWRPHWCVLRTRHTVWTASRANLSPKNG